MTKITDIFEQKPHTFSFELFPPKTDEGYQKLLETIKALAGLKPDFISVTYGAGGGSRDKTFDIVQHIQDKHKITGVAHLTCVLHNKNEIKNILADIKNRGIKNVLALRGDPPKENPDWQPGKDNFRYSSELCAFIRKNFGEHFGIGVAGFPEGHLLCQDRDRDAQFLKIKIDNGADFVITQLFFDNKNYFDYVARLRKLGVKARVLPGIIPITDYQGLVRFCGLCGATVTAELKKIFEPIQNDKEATLKAGIDFAVRQCQELLAGGAPGLHFYTLNKSTPVDTILNQVRR
ncbi:MAG: methylenetetrahydrofolate reductase [NAD(P)H] [Omnitrophica WOR_2 bacterium RIFCSPHIGHO2_01_FULL_48_9]|nr:MAG: methylenetetrahydrofolate reductase [NAD(P)H] [Omnitrophica WOR_2 bacterium RIFCSPHIGHO2_02_FULL_48_11]OGX33397.1 MAG: methylenetetrahydrofolate reductase [NAD(P)H] [Omnitrophica WOR_2 bacterium RIFCSPHIGHO2_01_FULL_48_9]